MNTTAHHGVRGCYCEDCLGNRIPTHVEPASPERRVDPLRTRQLRFRFRLTGDRMLRRVS